MQVRIENLRQVVQGLPAEAVDELFKHHRKMYRFQMLLCLWYAFWVGYNLYWTAHYARENRTGMTIFFGTFLCLWIAMGVNRWSPVWEVKRHDEVLTVLKEVRLGRTE